MKIIYVLSYPDWNENEEEDNFYHVKDVLRSTPFWKDQLSSRNEGKQTTAEEQKCHDKSE